VAWKPGERRGRAMAGGAGASSGPARACPQDWRWAAAPQVRPLGVTLLGSGSSCSLRSGTPVASSNCRRVFGLLLKLCREPGQEHFQVWPLGLPGNLQPGDNGAAWDFAFAHSYSFCGPQRAALSISTHSHHSWPSLSYGSRQKRRTQTPGSPWSSGAAQCRPGAARASSALLDARLRWNDRNVAAVDYCNRTMLAS
jgi:hypothetical protein